MWNLEKWYRWSYLQNRNRDTDIENKQRMNCEIETDIYTILCIKLRSWHPVPSLHGKQMGKQWKQWQTLFLASKVTADGDCSHEIKRHLLLGRKAMTNLDSIFKSRDITLPTKVHPVKAMVFPVVMYGCASWTIQKLSAKELMLLNCGVGEDSWGFFGLQGDPTSQS